MTLPTAWQITERRGREGLLSLEADWRRLYAAMTRRTSFVSFEACRAYLDHCHRSPDRVRCLVVSSGREVRAICVLEPRTERRLGFRFGVWGMLWMHRQCHHADLVCPDEDLRRELVPLLAGHLRRHREGRLVMVLGPLEPDAALWGGLDRLLPADRCVDQTERIRVMDCRAPFARLEAGFSRNFRRNLKVARKRLEELPDVRFRVVRETGALAAELPTFLDLETSGWKGEGRSSIRHRAGLADYYADLAGSLAGERDYCEIIGLYTGDRCIASVLAARTGATLSALKTGYDQAYGRYSPGQLVIAHLVERCCADPGVERVNFVSEAPWLQSWPSDLLDVRQVFVNIDGVAGRVLIALLRFRLGRLRRLAAWAQPRLRRLGLLVEEES